MTTSTVDATLDFKKARWEKQGLVYCPSGQQGWNRHTFMTPTPVLMPSGTLRLYGGLRNEHGISRIGYVDVDANDPTNVLHVSDAPVLELGPPGCFDDNGMILGDVLFVNNALWMYYVGFQLVKNVKFLAFSGLAISEDNGKHFKRFRQTPVLDRAEPGLYIQAIHSVIYENNVFKVWYSVDKGWEIIDGQPFPRYSIWYTTSNDGYTFDQPSHHCIDTMGSEYRIGRPRVYKKPGGGYFMLYTRDHLERNYISGYAESEDGIHWTRMDEYYTLEKSQSGWDSEMCCYPVLFSAGKKHYMFYNGNDFGRTGVGYAQWIQP